MTVDDRSRLNLHRKLEAVLGREEADHLMAHLPPVTWNEVATKDDLAALGSSTRTEMRALAAQLRAEIRAGDEALRTEMKVGFAELRTEMQAIRADFVEGTTRQIKWLVTFAAAWTSLLVTVVRL